MPHPERACEASLEAPTAVRVGLDSWSLPAGEGHIECGHGSSDERDRPFMPSLERHGLKPDEYERILQLMGREPNLPSSGCFP